MKTIVTLLLFAAAGALIYWVVLPFWTEIQGLRAEQAVLGDALARLQDLEKLRDDLLKTFNSIPKESLKRLDDFLPARPDNGNILAMLEKLSRDRGMRLEHVDFAKDFSQPAGASQQNAATQGRIVPKTEVPYNQITYSFSAAGTYETFRSLLDALEKDLRVVDVEELGFAGSTANLFDFNFKVRSYYQK